jgi:hypothetical protein
MLEELALAPKIFQRITKANSKTPTFSGVSQTKRTRTTTEDGDSSTKYL